MMKSHSLRKLLAAVMVVAMLVMVLPMTVLAVQPAHAKANRGLAIGRDKDKVKVEDNEVEPSEEEEEKSWRAEFVHMRNDWAKSEGVRIPPGHANLMLRYLISLEEPDVQPEGDPEDETQISLSFADYADDLAELFEQLKTDGFIDSETGRLNVKAFKVFAQMSDEDDLEPVTTVA